VKKSRTGRMSGRRPMLFLDDILHQFTHGRAELPLCRAITRLRGSAALPFMQTTINNWFETKNDLQFAGDRLNFNMLNLIGKRNWIWLTLVTFLAAGCVTQRINWNARVGTYTFDQAVIDFGPPDKQAKLSDGRRVAEWISRYSSGGTVMFGTGLYNYPGGVGFVQTTGPEYYENKLRLTFTTNDVLSAWSKH